MGALMIHIFQRCPQFKQVTQTFLAPMFPATRPMPPVSAAPTTAFPIPKPFLLAERDVEPHLGQQATPFCLFSLMRSRLLCGFEVGHGVFFTVMGLDKTFSELLVVVSPRETDAPHSEQNFESSSICFPLF